MEPIGLVEMSRGCTFRCDFCALNRDRLGWSERLPATVIREVRWLAEHGVTTLQLIDQTLGLNRTATNALLDGFAEVRSAYPHMRIDILTRPEFVTPAFAAALRRGGVTRCAIGMESMDAASLSAQQKSLRPPATATAVRILASAGIEAKLFHMLFPAHCSTETLRFLSALAAEDIPFIVQSSFLRGLAHRNSEPNFLKNDHTVFVPAQDTVEQLMEWMLVNLAFPSMDVGDGGDPELRAVIAQACRNERPIASLFRTDEQRQTLRLRTRTREYVYEHRDGQPAAACCTVA